MIPRVLPEHRRRGYGTALLERLVDHVAGLGHPTVRAGADDDGSLAFAHRFGFEEVNREVEQTYRLTGPVEPTPAPDGIEVVTAQERPGLWEAAYEGFGLEALADFAVDAPLEVSPGGVDALVAGRPDVPRPPRRRGRRVRRAGARPRPADPCRERPHRRTP